MAHFDKMRMWRSRWRNFGGFKLKKWGNQQNVLKFQTSKKGLESVSWGKSKKKLNWKIWGKTEIQKREEINLKNRNKMYYLLLAVFFSPHQQEQQNRQFNDEYNNSSSNRSRIKKCDGEMKREEEKEVVIEGGLGGWHKFTYVVSRLFNIF